MVAADLLLVHDIGVYQHGEEDNARHFKALADSGVKALAELKKSGEIKGVGIGGKAGQPVLASAPGKVLYSGDGIRGYGKLVIIKHNDTFLSAYAHNDQILVKEGQTVTKGQKIAEVGSTGTDQTKLHFEIRRFGKPTDPVKFLPAR